MCMSCAHFLDEADGLACAAFPSGIPEPIINNEVDHRQPYPNDNGIMFLQAADRPVPLAFENGFAPPPAVEYWERLERADGTGQGPLTDSSMKHGEFNVIPAPSARRYFASRADNGEAVGLYRETEDHEGLTFEYLSREDRWEEEPSLFMKIRGGAGWVDELTAEEARKVAVELGAPSDVVPLDDPAGDFATSWEHSEAPRTPPSVS